MLGGELQDPPRWDDLRFGRLQYCIAAECLSAREDLAEVAPSWTFLRRHQPQVFRDPGMGCLLLLG